MRRLQSFYAVLATIFAVAASILTFFLVCIFGIPDIGLLLWFLFAGATFAFTLSLVIGHYLAEPLTDLHVRAQAILHGDARVDIKPEGKLYEADKLAEDFVALSAKTKAQMSDLSVQENRQTRFISDVAHELRTPLTAIRGNAETLMDPDMPPALRERFCQTIINESERLTRLSNDLLTLQHIEEGTDQVIMKRVNLHDVAERVADAMNPIFEENGAELKIEGEAPDVLGNPDSLRQAVTNLVENASRFIKPGGHINVELFGMNGNSIIAVKDDGCGFGDVDPKLLFDRFYRTDASRTRGTGGTGLGLAIVKSIAEAHDGTVEAVNLPEGGACFMIAIPSIPADISVKKPHGKTKAI